MNIEGKWTGTIVYGKEYGKHSNKELFFDLEIIQDSDKISGNAMDIRGAGSSPDPATINGTIDGTSIKFIKQYSSWHYYYKGATKVDKSRAGSEIHYSGQWMENEQRFKGDWIIYSKVKIFGIFPYKYHCTGTWTMFRK
jgi:hypothetical protein